jgi:hypothetical protein
MFFSLGATKKKMIKVISARLVLLLSDKQIIFVFYGYSKGEDLLN